MKNLFLFILILFAFPATAQTPLWGFRIGGAGVDASVDCQVAPNGNIYVIGNFSGTVDLDPGSGVYNVTSNGQFDVFAACYSPSGSFLWGFGIGGPNKDYARHIAVDASSNLIFSGNFQGGMDFDPGVGVAIIPFAGGVGTADGDGFVAKYSSTGAYMWAKGLGGFTMYDYAEGVGADELGNVYIGGQFTGTMIVSPTITFSSSTVGAAYIIKYNSSGTVIWGHNFGEAGSQAAVRSILVRQGYIYCCGIFEGNADFCPWGTPAMLSATAGPFPVDGFMAKYDTAGNYVFARQLKGIGAVSVDEYSDISLDASGNIYVSGWGNSSSFVFDPASPGTTTLIAPGGGGNNDIIFAKYSSSGAYQWARVIGSPFNEWARWSIEVADNDLFITGNFQGTTDFDPSPGVANLTSSGGEDIFFAKYDLNGNYICAFRIGSAATGEIGNGLSHDTVGNIYLSGQFAGTGIDFDPGMPVYPLTSSGSSDAFVVKYTFIKDTILGTVAGDTICAGATAYITVDITTGPLTPYSITFTNGTSSFTATGVTSGVPVPVSAPPLGTSTYWVSAAAYTGFSGCFPPTVIVSGTALVLVNPAPGPITGNIPICVGGAITLGNSLLGGTWSCAPLSVATISTTGVVTAVAAGTALVSYITSCGTVTAIVSVNSSPGTITGNVPVCVGGAIVLSNSLPGGVWSIAPSSVATITSGGTVTGVGAGTATVFYVTTCGTVAATVTVNGLPGIISGNAPLCAGSTITLSNSLPSGVWSIAPSSVATITSSGIVTGVGAGTATVSYVVTCGTVTATVTVNGVPGAITGNAPLCVGNTIVLSNSLPGGAWSAAPSSVATISPGGIVTGVGMGTATLSYVTTCGTVTATVTVNGLPGIISGNAPMCVGSTITLSNSLPGGIWSIAPSSVATIASGGIVTGVGAGTATVSYVTICGTVTATVTVNGLPGAITGNAPLCVGSAIALSNSLPGGVWSIATSSVATITSGGIVTGVGAGTATVSYVTTCGTVIATVTVNGLPGIISGNTPLCAGGAITLVNSLPGGTWSLAPSTVATITSGGIVTGVGAGTAIVSYTTFCGSVFVVVTVTGLPGIITGNAPLCPGNTITLSNSLAGGSWSCFPASVAVIASTGDVTAIALGTAIVSYVTVCGTVTATVTVNGTPGSITGNAPVCMGSFIVLANTLFGGVWSCVPSSIATISPTGAISPVSAGTATVSYVTTCGTVTTIVTVNALPGPITGNMPFCIGTTISLSNSLTGGTWSCAPASVATISAGGVVTGIGVGTATVSYTTDCGIVSIVVTVNGLPGPINGGSTLCVGASITLTNTLPGGTWSCTPVSVATIGAGGDLTGISAGTAIVSYTTFCGSVTVVVTVIGLPGPIVGNTPACPGGAIALSNSLAGGAWSCAPSAIATITSSGVVSAVSAGTAIVSYTTTCGTVSVIITVNSLPGIISGNIPVCPGNTISLSNPLPGGVWSCTPSTVATINPVGVVTAISSGTATVSYVTTCGSVTAIITVNPLPGPITGNNPVCMGSSITLSNSLAGGTWSCVPASIAIISATGVITTISAGTATVTYTTTCGTATAIVTVVPLPGIISGNIPLCPGNTITLSNPAPGGAWICAPSSVATITTFGDITAVATGTADVSYLTTCGNVSAIVTVDPLPGPIAGNTPVCTGNTISLSNSLPGGTWSCTPPSMATISLSGIVTTILAGTATVTYSTTCGAATTVITANPTPGPISGNVPICPGNTITLTNAIPGGIWSCAPSSVATISATGVVTGIAAGTAIVSYAVGICRSAVTVTVNPSPVITGVSFVNPICGGPAGSITINGLTPGATYTVYYTYATPVTTAGTASSFGTITITGLAAGMYSAISVTNSFGCTSNVAGPVVLIDTNVPETPVIVAGSPCQGDTLWLRASSATTGVSYHWSGPAGFTATVSDTYIYPAFAGNSGSYTVTAVLGMCTSAPATVNVIVHPQPVVTGISFGNPGSCYGNDGWIDLNGLVAGETYIVNYLFNGTLAIATLTADGSGKLRLSGLVSGTYASILLTSSFGCVSASIGPVELYFPGTPPPPVIEHNDPCVGQILFLRAYDAMPGGTYSWSYPDGGGSTLQNHARHNVTTAAAGIYTVTYTVEGCPNTTTANVMVYTPVVLTDVTLDQTIPFGTSIQLNSQGAVLYRWTPNDGSLNNPNINNPVATPDDSTTYTVYGTGDGGCIDSAKVTIRISDDIDEFIPTAFTPNGDGLNDIFRIRNMRTQSLVEFSVYNRYGERVYFNSYARDQGWDGTYKGVPCDAGTYFYYVIVGLRNGTNRIHKGDVTLIK